jgi:hypothetical protein
LAARIERRLETAHLLEPKQVRLTFTDTPLPEAVAELKRQTGYNLQLGSDPNRLANRKITLDTGSVPFWRALELFCEKAGLSERNAGLPTGPEARATLEASILRARRLNQQSGYAGLGETALQLVDVRPVARPTSVTGAVRFQVVPATGNWLLTSNNAETLLLLEITAEPRLTWQGALDVRVEKALDENGQLLTPVATPMLPTSDVDLRLLLEAELGRGEASSQVAVRLRKGSKPATLLRELRGTVTAQVLTPPQAILTIADVLRAGGQTFKGTDGAAVQVLEAGRQANGSYRLRLQTEGLPRGVLVRAGGLIVRANGAARILTNQVAGSNSTWALQDAEGRAFRCVAFEANYVALGGGVGQEIRLTFEPDPRLGEPTRLVQKGRRTVLLDVPFTFENVPLP